MSDKRIAVFDLDGTLVDSMRDLVPALNETVAVDGVPPTDMSDVGHVVGQGALKMIEKAFDFHGIEMPADRPQELLPQFLSIYENRIAHETVFFDGVFEALDAIENEGWLPVVCTNKYERLARLLIKGLGQSDRFPIITGGDTFEFKKPDPHHIIETVKLAGGDPHMAVMVGDSVNDIYAAQKASIPCIAVDFGYSDLPVEDLKPDAIISHFNELPDAVKTVARAR